MAGAFLWDERVARAVGLSALGTQPVASMPLSNLLDPQPSHRARWLGTTASVLVDFGADTALDAVALLSTTLRSTDTVRWRLSALEGVDEAPAVFDMRFTSPATLAYPAGWAFNRASAGHSFDATGTLAQAAVDTLRFDYDPATLACRGILLEEARTNDVRNPRGEGGTVGIIGSGGVVPTNWVVPALAGITITYNGIVTENGLACAEFRFNGTATGNLEIAGDTWRGSYTNATIACSVFCKLAAGTLTNITCSINAYMGGAGGTNGNVTFVPTTAAMNGQRRLTTGTATTVNSCKTAVRMVCAGAVDFTLRCAVFQQENGRVSSSPILPPVGTPAASTRATDQARILGLSIAAATLLIQCQVHGGAPGNEIPGGYGPPGDYNNSSFFLFDTAGTCLWSTISGGVGSSRTLAGSVNAATTLVGAASATGFAFSRNSAQTTLAQAFAVPSAMDIA